MKRTRQQGLIFTYLLIGISLLSFMTMAYSKMSRTSQLGQWNHETREALLEQVSLIRGRIIACAVNFPAGDPVTNVRYPATPASTLVSDLACPGNPATNKNLWSGTGGLTFPAAPRRFTNWTYSYSASTGIRIAISPLTGAADANAIGVLDTVATRIGTSATRSGGTLTVTLMN
jgi:hypothetical protein